MVKIDKILFPSELREYSLKIRIGARHLWQRSQESGEEFTRPCIDH